MVSNCMGLGYDVVDVAALDEQLAEPGTRMRKLFSAREMHQALRLASVKGDGATVHLAAKWAGKEAVLKAWEEALGERPSPYTLDDFPWKSIEILDDQRGRPRVVLSEDVEETLRTSLAWSDGEPGWLISLSHDGLIAGAVVILVRRDPNDKSSADESPLERMMS
ncbi:holo-ACP synthase [Bifidobacterium lemurum]|nr:holo-ACP synthase [Bifidobacterium lemurum]QOL34802.1 holo-ACP synthase [Bifidobacterium lemurum]